MPFEFSSLSEHRQYSKMLRDGTASDGQTGQGYRTNDGQTLQGSPASDGQTSKYGKGPAGRHHLRFIDTTQSSNRDGEQLAHLKTPSMWNPFQPGPGEYGYVDENGTYGRRGYQGYQTPQQYLNQFRGLPPYGEPSSSRTTRDGSGSHENRSLTLIGHSGKYFNKMYEYTPDSRKSKAYRIDTPDGCTISVTMTLLRDQNIQVLQSNVEEALIRKEFESSPDKMISALNKFGNIQYTYTDKVTSIHILQDILEYGTSIASGIRNRHGQENHVITVDKVETDEDGNAKFVCIRDYQQGYSSYKVHINEWEKAWGHHDLVPSGILSTVLRGHGRK